MFFFIVTVSVCNATKKKFFLILHLMHHSNLQQTILKYVLFWGIQFTWNVKVYFLRSEEKNNKKKNKQKNTYIL